MVCTLKENKCLTNFPVRSRSNKLSSKKSNQDDYIYNSSSIANKVLTPKLTQGLKSGLVVAKS